MAYNRFILFPYKLGSKSAKLLGEKLQGKRVRPDGNYRYFPNHRVINWGNSAIPHWATHGALMSMLNKPQSVANASEKTRTFYILSQHIPQYLPEWTTSKDVAKGWLENPIYGSLKNAVVCRTLTSAAAGRGITLAGAVGELVNAPLYTRYKPKTAEYRIHCGLGTIIDRTQKKRRNGASEAEGIARYVRSHDNGWVFCHDSIEVPAAVDEAAVSAVAALGLDFGAVDVGYHPVHGVAVYEVNTAPGIEGTTLEKYSDFFRRTLQA